MRIKNTKLSAYLLAIWITFYQISFAECTLSTLPSPPIQKWEKNVDTLIQEIKKLSGSEVQCNKPEWAPKHLDVAIPIRSIQQLTWYMQSKWQSISALISEVRYYFDNSGMILPVEQNHQNSILNIQKKIVEAGIYIGNRCTQNKEFKNNVVLTDSLYKTEWKSIKIVLWDLSAQNTEVLKFFRNLVKNVQSREYITTNPLLTIAPNSFPQEMQDFYSVEAIQACHDEDPKNQSIKKTLKEAFTVWWKYPQAVKIWKDAFALLLYRSKTLVGAGETDAAKEAEIKNIVQAQKGGIGNSRFLINSQFFKEFGQRANNKTIMEQVKETGKRIAYEVYWPLFRRQVIEDAARSSENQAFVNLVNYAKIDNNARELESVDKSNYDAYGMRKIYVSQNKEQDPKTVTGLVQALEELEKARPTIEENVNLACNDVLNKQATNIDHPDCQDFMKW